MIHDCHLPLDQFNKQQKQLWDNIFAYYPFYFNLQYIDNNPQYNEMLKWCTENIPIINGREGWYVLHRPQGIKLIFEEQNHFIEFMLIFG